MKLTLLCENTTNNPRLKAEHGLSVHIQTDNGYQILFDTGASALFSENAEKLGIDLKEVDAVIISHGHYDHGGGLKTFFTINDKAKVYMNKYAFGDFYADGKEHYIGLDKTLNSSERIVFIGEYAEISPEIKLFSGVFGRELFSSINSRLLKKEGEYYCEDDFAHELNAAISYNGKTLLLAGCAHNGILNILKRYYELFNGEPDYVLSGLHLCDRHKNESEKNIISLADRLKEYKSKIFTCHCTGLYAYGILKEMLGNKIEYAALGWSCEI